MPELPEVETVRRGLNRLIKGKTIKDVNVLYDKIIVGSKAEFCKKLSGKKLLDVDRRGKYLLYRFSGDLTMVSHLRMEGKYFVRQKGEPVEKHTHVILYLMDKEASFIITTFANLGGWNCLRQVKKPLFPGFLSLVPNRPKKILILKNSMKDFKKRKSRLRRLCLIKRLLQGSGIFMLMRCFIWQRFIL